MNRKVVVAKTLESLGWWKPNACAIAKRAYEVLIELSKLDGIHHYQDSSEYVCTN